VSTDLDEGSRGLFQGTCIPVLTWTDKKQTKTQASVNIGGKSTEIRTKYLPSIPTYSTQNYIVCTS
jgi:hypothetical protein